jgi:hypothetical protein
MSCDNEFWEARRDKLAVAIAAYEDALIAFADSNTQSYTLDTGQTRTTVQRAEIGSLRNTYEALLSTYDDLCARICGASVVVRPVR